MKKFVKIIATLLCLITLFTGCSSDADTVSEAEINTESESTSEEVKTDEKQWDFQMLKSERNDAFSRSEYIEIDGKWTHVYEYILRGDNTSVLVTEERKAYTRTEEDGELKLIIDNVDVPQNEDIEIIETTSQFTLVKWEANDDERVSIYRYGENIDSISWSEYKTFTNGEWQWKSDFTPDVEPEINPYIFEETENGFRLLGFAPSRWSNGEPKYSFEVIEEACDAVVNYYWHGEVYFVKDSNVYCINVNTPWDSELVEENITAFAISDGCPLWVKNGEEIAEPRTVLWSK